MKRTLYSIVIYKKEGTIQKLNSINYETYEQAEEELKQKLKSLNLSMEDVETIKEVEGKELVLVFNGGTIIASICSFTI